ncbi:MAG TPA: hypothetical protein VKA46_10720 [Gemmataceae bacterium]|nr:hypothetical protein [Gemmataceae bacterium]
MPEDLLLELETAPPPAGSLENIEDLVRVVRRELGWVVKGIQGSAVTFEKAWRRIVMEVARGQTTEMHAARPRLLSAFEKRLSRLRETHALAAWLHKPGEADVPSPDVLLPEIAGMERLKAGVLDRWQTADDLEELAARDYPLTTADLDRLGPHRRPAASYYADESRPNGIGMERSNLRGRRN